MKIKEALHKGRLLLEAIEPEILLSHLLKKKIIELYKDPDYELNKDEKDKYEELLNKRKGKYPLEYLVGKTEFMAMPFKITEDVLIPRKETEILTEVSIKEAKKLKNPKIIDIGCGSGVIAVSIKRYHKEAKVFACDVSEKAIFIACENARFNNTKVSFICCNLLDAIKGKFDIIVSNPPYVEESLVLEYEPKIALCGGRDGLDFYPKIFKKARDLLNPKGLIILEIPYKKKEAISEIAKGFCFSLKRIVSDYNSIERVLIFHNEAFYSNKKSW